jgi:hypothetical protein
LYRNGSTTTFHVGLYQIGSLFSHGTAAGKGVVSAVEEQGE